MKTTTENLGNDREKELLAQAKKAHRQGLNATKNATLEDIFSKLIGAYNNSVKEYRKVAVKNI